MRRIALQRKPLLNWLSSGYHSVCCMLVVGYATRHAVKCLLCAVLNAPIVIVGEQLTGYPSLSRSFRIRCSCNKRLLAHSQRASSNCISKCKLPCSMIGPAYPTFLEAHLGSIAWQAPHPWAELGGLIGQPSVDIFTKK